jgi:hypothetical protein
LSHLLQLRTNWLVKGMYVHVMTASHYPPPGPSCPILASTRTHWAFPYVHSEAISFPCLPLSLCQMQVTVADYVT